MKRRTNGGQCHTDSFFKQCSTETSEELEETQLTETETSLNMMSLMHLKKVKLMNHLRGINPGQSSKCLGLIDPKAKLGKMISLAAGSCQSKG